MAAYTHRVHIHIHAAGPINVTTVTLTFTTTMHHTSEASVMCCSVIITGVSVALSVLLQNTAVSQGVTNPLTEAMDRDGEVIVRDRAKADCRAQNALEKVPAA